MKSRKKIALISMMLGLTACVSTDNTDTQTVSLHNCAIQTTIPGAKATGAFLTIKAKKAGVSLTAAQAPTVTDHVEIHKMVMNKGTMKMQKIPSYPLQAGDNVFKKGGYHIMLMSMKKTLSAGEKHELILAFSDGSTNRCMAEVKSVKALTSKGTKMMKHSHTHGKTTHTH